MTMSRYQLSGKIKYIFLIDSEWQIFTKQVLTSCFFTLPYIVRTSIPKTIDNHDIEARYYIKDGYVHYHISNDTRRKIQKHLKDVYNIS